MKASLGKRWLPWLMFCAPITLILFVYRGAIFNDGMFSNGDVLFGFFPYFEYYLKGRALVTQNMFSGFPVFVSNVGVWFYPINRIVYNLLGHDALRAYTYLNVLNLILTYIFTYLFARKIKLSYQAAVLVGTVFTFAGQLMLWGQTLTNTNDYFLLPAVFYFFELARTRLVIPISSTKSRILDSINLIGTRYVLLVLAGLFLGLGWLSGHLQYVVYIHSLFALYVLYLAWRREISWPAAFISLVVSNAVSFLIGYPQIAAVLGWRAVSLRAGGVSLAAAYIGAYQPWDMIRLFLPFFSIPLIPFSNPNLYMGIAPLALLVISAWLWKNLRPNRQYLFWAGAFAFCFLASWKYLPITWALHQLPLFNSFREAPRIMFIGEFATAILVGMALDFILGHRDELTKHLRVASRVMLWISLPVALMAVAGTILYSLRPRLVALAQNYFLLHRYAQTSGLPKAHYMALINQYVSTFLVSISVYDQQIIILLLFLLLGYLVFKNFKVWVIVPVTVLNFAFVYADYVPTIPRANFNAVPETVQFIRHREAGSRSPFRVYVINPGFTLFQARTNCPAMSDLEAFELQKNLLQPNFNMRYNIDIIDGYDNFMPASVAKVLAEVGSESASARRFSVVEVAAQKDLLRQMNVKYLVSSEPITDPDFTELRSFLIGECRTTLHLYQLGDSLPRYYLDGPQEVLPVYGYDTISLITNSQSTSTLHIGNAYLPAWRATLDGRPVPILPDPPIYMKVTLSSGWHVIMLKYGR